MNDDIHKMVGETKCSLSYNQAGSFINVADWVLVWAAAIMVITAGGTLEWAASP